MPDKPSIAVLPFANMSGDPKQEYFSDGITDEIITGLSKISRLLVIARNSSSVFKNKAVDVKDVGKKLGVQYVMEGSVRKQGDMVRITAQLIDAKTGNHVWSERYDRKLKDIFAVQDEITLEIIRAMRVEIMLSEQARLWQRKGLTDNLVAFEKYLQARECSVRINKVSNHKARPRYEEAIAPDPRFATAYAKLDYGHMMGAWMNWSTDPVASGRMAFKLATKAVELDDSMDTPHYILGFILTNMGKYDQAIA